MPKRNNPFGDHSTLQLKTHVREKEVNNGVQQQTRMQSVYERTQDLLFNGMKQMQDESHEQLDANDNSMHCSDENLRADASALKQLHLDRNCQLVDSEESCITDMETDSNRCHGLLFETSVASGFSPVTKATANCIGLSLPSYGFSFGRSPNEYSPPGALSSEVQGHIPSTNERTVFAMGSSSHEARNAFLQMMQPQSKKSANSKCPMTNRACHNCRQPVQSRDVMKCQFCENYVCCSCARQCGGCHLHFCQLCSVMNYDKSSERAFCFNCQR